VERRNLGDWRRIQGNTLTTIVSMDPIDIISTSMRRASSATAERPGRGNADSQEISAPLYESPWMVDTGPAGSEPSTSWTIGWTPPRALVRCACPSREFGLCLESRPVRPCLHGWGARPIALCSFPTQPSPNDATRRVLETVGTDNRVVVRPVELGRQFGTLREIVGGVGPNDPR